MTYFTGLHPHIRSEDSVASRYWTAALLLLPCVIFKIISLKAAAVLFPALLLAAAGVHYLCGFIFQDRSKNSGWLRGILPFLSVLWFLVLPEKISFWPAVISFSFSLFLGYEVFGGLGAYAVNPVLAALIFTALFFPHENLNIYSGSSSFAIWNILTLVFLAFGGLYLGIRRKIRLLPALVFIVSVFAFSAVFARPIDFELLYCAFVFGFYLVTDSNTAPLKAGLHLFSAAWAGILMAGFILFGTAVLTAGAVSLALCGLAAPWLDSARFLGLKVKAETNG